MEFINFLFSLYAKFYFMVFYYTHITTELSITLVSRSRHNGGNHGNPMPFFMIIIISTRMWILDLICICGIRWVWPTWRHYQIRLLRSHLLKWCRLQGDIRPIQIFSIFIFISMPFSDTWHLPSKESCIFRGYFLRQRQSIERSVTGGTATWFGRATIGESTGVSKKC